MQCPKVNILFWGEVFPIGLPYGGGSSQWAFVLLGFPDNLHRLSAGCTLPKYDMMAPINRRQSVLFLLLMDQRVTRALWWGKEIYSNIKNIRPNMYQGKCWPKYFWRQSFWERVLVPEVLVYILNFECQGAESWRISYDWISYDRPLRCL